MNEIIFKEDSLNKLINKIEDLISNEINENIDFEDSEYEKFVSTLTKIVKERI